MVAEWKEEGSLLSAQSECTSEKEKSEIYPKDLESFSFNAKMLSPLSHQSLKGGWPRCEITILSEWSQRSNLLDADVGSVTQKHQWMREEEDTRQGCGFVFGLSNLRFLFLFRVGWFFLIVIISHQYARGVKGVKETFPLFLSFSAQKPITLGSDSEGRHRLISFANWRAFAKNVWTHAHTLYWPCLHAEPFSACFPACMQPRLGLEGGEKRDSAAAQCAIKRPAMVFAFSLLPFCSCLFFLRSRLTDGRECWKRICLYLVLAMFRRYMLVCNIGKEIVFPLQIPFRMSIFFQ